MRRDETMIGLSWIGPFAALFVLVNGLLALALWRAMR